MAEWVEPNYEDQAAYTVYQALAVQFLQAKRAKDELKTERILRVIADIEALFPEAF